MTEEHGESKSIPPYVGWKTFKNFIDGFRTNVPSRIDRSLMGTMSGATQAQLLTALRFMGLISDAGTPTQKLRDFARSDGDARRLLLGDIIADAYLNVLQGVDIDSGTYRQLSEAFGATGAQGETVHKCIAFYLSALREAGINYSPHFKIRGARGSTGRRRPKLSRGQPDRDESEDLEPTAPPIRRTRFEILVEKFPTFDPSWSADVQAKWFEAFARLQTIKSNEEIDT
jgi:Family of unknown function (DUF5343)